MYKKDIQIYKMQGSVIFHKDITKYIYKTIKCNYIECYIFELVQTFSYEENDGLNLVL